MAEIHLRLTEPKVNLIVDREEMATIWFALREYSDRLEESIKKAVNTKHEWEEKAFCYGQLAAVTALLFDIRDNHQEPKRTAVIKWLDV